MKCCQKNGDPVCKNCGRYLIDEKNYGPSIFGLFYSIRCRDNPNLCITCSAKIKQDKEKRGRFYMIFKGKFWYFTITNFLSDIFSKKDYELWNTIKKEQIEDVPYLLEKEEFITKDDNWYFDKMLHPAALCYYRAADCSSYARFWFELLKNKNIPCKMYAMTTEKDGHAVVMTGNTLYSNMKRYTGLIGIEAANEIVFKNRYTEFIVIQEYKGDF